ncbi:hypothetical protein ACFXB3_38840 [Streptomyces sp. NPDC059447]|uniref:hypothetical protein n=1 Tax=Streptomyces sp. NPDC059447 TaxID=3346834 RepID=UPI0036CD78D4
MNASAADRPPRASRRGVRTATLLCTTAALAAAMIPVSAHSAGRATARPADPAAPVVVVDCSAQPQIRPEEYLLACGDGNNRLVGLHWDSWGTKTATATGVDMVNDCRPYCAAGRFRPYPVSVTLSNPQVWPENPGLQRYSTIRLVYTDTSPAPVAKDVTYKLVY